MPEKSLEVHLVTNDHPNQFTLTSDFSHYSVTLNAETDIIFNDWLGRLRPVFVDQSDPDDLLPSSELLRNVGTWLWNALLPDSAPAQQRDMLARALRTGRSPLLLALPDALTGLPWELLCDPEQPSERGFLARRRPLIRLTSSVAHASEDASPLRVLLLISSPTSLGEESRVDVESERAAVEQATHKAREEGRLHLLVEDIVTIQRVQDALINFQPHLVHYIGHGEYDTATGGGLLWEDERGNELEIPPMRLAELLSPHNIHAVVLHACKTGRRDTQVNVRNVAETLVYEGIPIVLAQQASFTYESSQWASKAWYTALTAGRTVAEALFALRQALALHDRPDWAIPILYGNPACLMPILNMAVPPGLPDPLLAHNEGFTDLPAPVGVFVGRHRELRALKLLLESRPGSGPVMAFILGPGGVGKSTLIAQALSRYSKDYKAILTLSCLGYKDIGLFLQRIGEFLQRQGVSHLAENVLPKAKLSTEAKVEESVHVLNQAGPFVVVIDNLDDALDQSQRLRDPHLLYLLQNLLTNLHRGRILITGRARINGFPLHGKFVANLLRFDLEDLSSYEINQLLDRHPALSQLGEAVRAILIKEFGGLPYIYDLLSSESAGQSLDRLISDIHGRVTAEHKRRRAEKWSEIWQEVVEFATLEVTTKRLSEPARLLLAQLSVIRRPFPVEAMEQGLQATQVAWQPLLDWSLLRYDASRHTYHLHSVTKHYAETLLSEPDRKKIQAQMAEWYIHDGFHDPVLDSLEAYWLYRASGEMERAGELVIELAEPYRHFGLYSLLRMLCVTTRDDLRGRNEELMCDMSRILGILAWDQGDSTHAHQFYQQSLEISELLGDLPRKAASLHELAILAQEQENHIEAQRLLQQSLEICEQLGNQNGKATNLHELAILAFEQKNYTEAQRLLQQSLEIWEQLGDQHGKAASLHEMGLLAQAREDNTQASQLFQQSLEIQRHSKDLQARALLLNNMGKLARLQGNNAEAYQLSQQSMEIRKHIGDRRGKADNLHEFGILAQEQKDYDGARQLFQQSMEIRERLGDLHGKDDNLQHLRSLVQKQGDYTEVRQFLQQSLEVSERLNDQASKAESLHQMGRFARLQGDYTEARQHLQQELEIRKRLDDPCREAWNMYEFGILAFEQKNYTEAQQLLQQSLETFERLGDLHGQAGNLHQMGLLAQVRGDNTQASQLFQQSLEMREQLGKLEGVGASLHQLGILAQVAGDFVQARKYYLQSLDVKEQLGDPHGKALSLAQLGAMLALKLGDFEEALTYLIPAFLLLEKLGSPTRSFIQQLLALIRHQMGEGIFTSRWQSIAGNAPLPPALTEEEVHDVEKETHKLAQQTTQQLAQIILDFIQAPILDDKQHFLETHTMLLEPGVEVAFEHLAAMPEFKKVLPLEGYRLFLKRCREIGITAAFAEQRAAQQNNPQMAFMSKLRDLCSTVVIALGTKNTKRKVELASHLKEMAESDLPVIEARDFLYVLAARLLQEDNLQALIKQAEALYPVFRDAYTQMMTQVEQAEDIYESDIVVIEDLPYTVSSLLLRGTIQQRQQFAARLVMAQQSLPLESASLHRFLGCLVTTLHNEETDIAVLEAPYTQLWQEFRDALNKHLS